MLTTVYNTLHASPGRLAVALHSPGSRSNSFTIQAHAALASQQVSHQRGLLLPQYLNLLFEQFNLAPRQIQDFDDAAEFLPGAIGDGPA